jgi:hypothetical protein
MDSDLTWRDEGSILVCTNSGEASADELIAVIELVASQTAPGSRLSALVDHTDLGVTDLTVGGIEQTADVWTRLLGDRSIRAAFVVGPEAPLRFGLTRMFEAFLTFRTEAAVGVFEDADEAMAWLRDDEPSL